MRAGRHIARSAPAAGIALLALSATGCGALDQQTAPTPTVTVSLNQATVVATVDTLAGQPALRFTVDASIHNEGPGSVYLRVPCDPPVEERTATGWTSAIAGTVCELVARAPIEIPAGETLLQHVTVRGTLGRTTSGVGGIPQWLPGSTVGSYRIEFTLVAHHEMLPIQSRVSPTFTIDQ